MNIQTMHNKQVCRPTMCSASLCSIHSKSILTMFYWPRSAEFIAISLAFQSPGPALPDWHRVMDCMDVKHHTPPHPPLALSPSGVYKSTTIRSSRMTRKYYHRPYSAMKLHQLYISCFKRPK